MGSTTRGLTPTARLVEIISLLAMTAEQRTLFETQPPAWEVDAADERRVATVVLPLGHWVRWTTWCRRRCETSCSRAAGSACHWGAAIGR